MRVTRTPLGGGLKPMVVRSSPGGQRRRTIPRGAQFCSIYLQNHINKCCRIVQLLKSKAAWLGGDAKDEIIAEMKAL